MRLLILVLAIGSFCVSGQNLSGVINQYIEVTAVDVNRHAVDVVSSSGIAVDDSLLLFQMQGAEISTSQVDSSNGTVTNYNGTGSWELAEVCAVDGNTITFKKQFDQEFSDDGLLQLIPINYYSNAVITDTVKCQAWNGTTGGIVVIFNHGTLDFQSSIQVSKLGFRGGQHVESTFSCSFALNLEDYEYDSNTGRAAQKGEGIAFYGNLDGGRGPLGNGGGGGNDHNSGGGGGSNIAGGGIGGENDDPGVFTCKGYFPGLPGRSLASNNERLFMGGGAGAGHSNSTWVTHGGNGAGIVIIVSDAIEGNNENILAFGGNAPEAHGDGAGGGGAGGSVCLFTDNINSTLNIDVHGGNGGNMDASIASNTDRCFGPGGGGAGGLIRYSTATAPANVVSTLNGGLAGIVVNSTAGCNGSTINAGNGGAGVEEFNGEVPEGFKCNPYCDLVHDVDLGDNINTCDQDSAILDAGYEGAQYTYDWSTGETSQTIEVFGSGTYSIILDDGYCISCDTLFVDNLSKPELPSQLFFDICGGGSVILDAENPGASYDWSTGASSQTIQVNEGGLYVVNIWDGGCGIAAFFDVFECFDPPNTITPNGDGANDYWIIDQLNNSSNNSVEIFNRRGQSVFKADNYQGQFNGDGLPGGVYYYHLDLKNGRDPIVGTLTIVR